MPLILNEKRIVPPEGDPHAKIAIVGEAPGREEDRLLRPWVGTAGNLLEELLASNGILRRHVYLTNVIKEKPPDTASKKNDISKFISFGKGSPTCSKEYLEYIEMLKEELAATTCNVIVAAGAIPLYALTGQGQILKRRGSIYESTLLPGRKILATIHPAAVLYGQGGGMYIWRNFIMFDLNKAKIQSEFPEIRIPQRDLEIYPAFERALSFIKQIQNAPYVAYDIEVVNLEVSHISFSTDPKHAMSVCFIHNGRNHYEEWQELELWREIAVLLEKRDVLKIAQNAYFDNTFLFNRYGIRVHNTYDTMVGQAILFPDFPKGLDFQCSIYTDEPYYKDERKQYISIDNQESFARYNAKDSAVLLEIKPELDDGLNNFNNTTYATNHMKLLEPLTYMGSRGMLVDVENLKHESETTLTEIERLTKEFQDLCGYEINPKSSVQVIRYFYGIKGLKPYLSKGRPTCDDIALQRIIRKYKLREAEILRDFRTLHTKRSNFLEMRIDPDNRLRCSWNIVGTRYSRFSSSENIFGTGRNMQNFPHDTRKFLLPDPGYILYELDYEQADWRVVAYLSTDADMIRAAEAGKAHEITASYIFNIPPEKVSDEPGSAPQFGTGEFSQRFWGKKANHAFNYGQTASAFALQMLISENEARHIREAYFRAYPNVQNVFWQDVKNDLQATHTVKNLFDRTYFFQGRMDQQLFNEAYAYIPQSTVADAMNQWAILPLYFDTERFGPVELLMQIHDSIVFQIPIAVGLETHERMLRDLKALVEQPLECKNRTFIIPADLKASIKNLQDKTRINWNSSIANQLEDIIGGKFE